MTDKIKEDLEELASSADKPFQIKRQEKGYDYEITLSEEVEFPPFKYSELCSLLREEVREEDTVTIYLSNYGGCCDSAATIINAIKDCKAEVKCVVTAASYSAATLIALSTDTLEIKPYALLMFHNFSSETKGKAGELKAGVINTEKLIHSMMSDIYYPFLTKKEIDTIFNDRDIYVHWDDKDLKDRIKRHFEPDE